MTIWCNSKGIMARKSFIEACFKDKLAKTSFFTSYQPNDRCIGWGSKANSKKFKLKAESSGVQFTQLEDGFIGYIGHPAKQGTQVAVISDNEGIYYDAHNKSSLELLIPATLSSEKIQRASNVIRTITLKQITKYNCYEHNELVEGLADNLNFDGRKCILLVDQVANDLSIEGAMANEASFINMYQSARAQFPDGRLLLRTHPDTRLGQKKGILARMALPDVERLTEHCHPHALLKNVDAVFTVSSQLGFEALLYKIPVYCFGLPFYAGWGLTHDSVTCHRRSSASLEQLVYAALIEYSCYVNPVSQSRCEIEEILQLIALQTKSKVKLNRLYLLGFSLWKRGFIKRFTRHLAEEQIFIKSPPKMLKANENILVWGNKYPDQTPCIRVEDGFIRSNGLGVNLHQPSSLSFDQRGLYFDSTKTNDLERLLNNRVIEHHELIRGEALATLLKSSGVSKYNVGKAKNIKIDAGGRKVILVVGQVDSDASILLGSALIKNNEALLQQVKKSNDQAFIIYKPHPDVVSGNRKGKVNAKVMNKCVNLHITQLPLTSLYAHIDELHTITSLSGFEALSHGIEVHVWGQPFYAGWGLTTDYYAPIRRERTLPLAELLYICLVEYPLYIDWTTGLWISPEMLIAKLSRQPHRSINKQCWFVRQLQKLIYLFKSL